MLGDGHGVEAGHVGDPHPFVGGRIKVDVVDPDPELLDEAEAAGSDGPPGQRRRQMTTTLRCKRSWPRKSGSQRPCGS